MPTALKKKEEIRRDNEIKWFNDLIGKYVSINHNGVAYTVLYVDKTPVYGLCTRYDVFNVYWSKNKFSIEKEVGREINNHWFKCPYSEISYGGEHSSMKIITKEEYQEIEKTFNEYKTKGELLHSMTPSSDGHAQGYVDVIAADGEQGYINSSAVKWNF